MFPLYHLDREKIRYAPSLETGISKTTVGGNKEREIIRWLLHRILEILTAGDRTLFLSGKELLSLVAAMFPLARLLSVLSLA